MKAFRIPGIALCILLLALAVSACQKKSETDMSQMSDTTMANAPSEAPPDQTTPTTGSTNADGATLPQSYSSAPTKKTSKSTRSGGTAVNASARTVDIATGTVFDVAMVTPVDTRTSNVGDKIEGKLTAPIVSGGMTLAPEGALVRGEITDLKRASRSKSEENRASVTLTFTSIETVDGAKTLHATVANSEGKLVAKSTSTRDKLIIGGSTVAGAVIGKVAGKDTKSTIIGAVGGAVVGTGAVLAAKGYELNIEEGAKVSLRVDQPIAIVSR